MSINFWGSPRTLWFLPIIKFAKICLVRRHVIEIICVIVKMEPFSIFGHEYLYFSLSKKLKKSVTNLR